MGHIKNEPVIRDPVQLAYVIERRVKYIFYPPLLSDQIRKIVRPMFRKKGHRRRKNFWVFFFKNLRKNCTVSSGFKRFLSGFSMPPQLKSPLQSNNLRTPFFARWWRAKIFRQIFVEQIFILARYPPGPP